MKDVSSGSVESVNGLATDSHDSGSEPRDGLLATQELCLQYGHLVAVDHVSLVIEEGARHALIGPNGAGKSSLFSVLAGAVRPTAGRVYLGGSDITADDEVLRARAGIIRTFQHSNLFIRLTAIDNVRIALERVGGMSMRPWPSRRDDRWLAALALEHLDRVGLAEKAYDRVEELSHGERRQLEVSVAQACGPRLLLLDEPTAGMSAAEAHRFTNLILSMSREVTTVIVEHDLDVVFKLADRVSVLSSGQLIADGTPSEIKADERVNEVYLGTDRSEEPLFDGGRR